MIAKIFSGDKVAQAFTQACYAPNTYYQSSITLNIAENHLEK